jgi:uracil-DNA glycosylase family 4
MTQNPLDRVVQLEELWAEIEPCRLCPAYEGITQKVFGSGNVSSPLLLVGEAPGEEEDRVGKPFIGDAGQLLTEICHKAGIDRERVFIANAVKCRPTKGEPGSLSNRTPKNAELAACRPFLMRQIEIIDPRVILVMGKTAAAAILNRKIDKVKIGDMLGKTERWNDRWLVFTNHPAAPLYAGRNVVMIEKMVDHFKRAKEIVYDAG